MAGVATAAVSSPPGLTCTNLRSSLSPPRNPPQSLLLHHRLCITGCHGRSRLINVQRAKLSGSMGEEELEENDEAFSYTNNAIEEEYESDEEEETESSVDLLFRFLHSMFKKVSKRVRKASVPSYHPAWVLSAAGKSMLWVLLLNLRLYCIKVEVSFAVDGVLLLASLSTLKALLEVACTIGGTVFVVILLLRAIWAATSYFQASGGSNFSQGGSSYGRIQPVT